MKFETIIIDFSKPTYVYAGLVSPVTDKLIWFDTICKKDTSIYLSNKLFKDYLEYVKRGLSLLTSNKRLIF